MLYSAILWFDADIPNDQNTALSLDAIKKLVKNFEPVNVYLRNVKFPVGTLTRLELSDGRNFLEGTIDVNNVMSEKLSPYDIYPVMTTFLKKDPSVVENLGHSLVVGYVTLQGVQPNILTPPIKKLTDQLPPP